MPAPVAWLLEGSVNVCLAVGLVTPCLLDDGEIAAVSVSGHGSDIDIRVDFADHEHFRLPIDRHTALDARRAVWTYFEELQDYLVETRLLWGQPRPRCPVPEHGGRHAVNLREDDGDGLHWVCSATEAELGEAFPGRPWLRGEPPGRPALGAGRPGG